MHKTNGEVIELTNPTNMPDPSEIEYMEEPVVSAEIMVTTEFIGPIMELCQERRGVYLGMEYNGKQQEHFCIMICLSTRLFMISLTP